MFFTNATFYRAIAVYFPRTEIFTQRTMTKIMIGFCWIVPLCLLLLPLSGAVGHFGLECGTRDCVIIKDGPGIKMYNFLTLFGFILPIITLVVANSAIYYKVKV